MAQTRAIFGLARGQEQAQVCTDAIAPWYRQPVSQMRDIFSTLTPLRSFVSPVRDFSAINGAFSV
jgi:hypothetical protein